jgi:hypothetical protein
MPNGNWVLTHIEVFEALLHSSPVFDEPAARVLRTGSMPCIQQQLIGVNYLFPWTTVASPYRIDSPYLLLSDGSLPH